MSSLVAVCRVMGSAVVDGAPCRLGAGAVDGARPFIPALRRVGDGALPPNSHHLPHLH